MGINAWVLGLARRDGYIEDSDIVIWQVANPGIEATCQDDVC